MDKKQAIVFLFAIAKEMKRTYESPVILLTMKDYADCIFKSLIEMRSALLQNAAPERVMEIISNFHLQWLQAVQDVEIFKKQFRDMPRGVIIKALEFTKECTKNRRKYFQKYIEEVQSAITAEENKLIKADVDIIEDMHAEFNSALDDKLKYILYQVDLTEYGVRIMDEIEELLNWLDKLNDHLAVELSKASGLKHTQLLCHLTKTLRDVIKNISASDDVEEKKIENKMQSKEEQLQCAIRWNESTDIEISKLIEKIKSLENRIDRLKVEDSSAVMALQHKSLHLEEKLHSLENLKLSLFKLKHMQLEEIDCQNVSEYTEFHIFDHLLPIRERSRLVEELVNLWHDAIFSISERKSIISILSVADIKEVFRDELGKFTVDKHGRKLYRIDNTDTVYQVNQHNELVEVKDDESHVYFYDDCGRYYLDNLNKRVYKAYGTESEYIINREGKMLKLREKHHNIEYWYDHLGRYYIDKDGSNVYCEENAKYEHDGLGNLIRIRSNESLNYVHCPREMSVTEESKYLQKVVGVALKQCLAEVVLRQPLDPIKYLAESLERHRHAVMMKQKRLDDEMTMIARRKLMMNTSPSHASFLSDCEGETKQCRDWNFIAYETPKDF